MSNGHTLVEPIHVTPSFAKEWEEAEYTDTELKLLKTLMEMTPLLGDCQEKFLFVKEGLLPGLYTRPNEFGSGYVLYAFFGYQIPGYLLRFIKTKEESVAELSNPAHRQKIRTLCKKIYDTWVTVW